MQSVAGSPYLVAAAVATDVVVNCEVASEDVDGETVVGGEGAEPALVVSEPGVGATTVPGWEPTLVSVPGIAGTAAEPVAVPVATGTATELVTVPLTPVAVMVAVASGFPSAS